MACDSLYVAWLKAYHPYELYITMLKLYDEKKNTEKISAIISEMKKYQGIKLIPGRWGQDNRDWMADKENKTISQSLSSVRYMNKQVPKDLYKLSQCEKVSMGKTFEKRKDENGDTITVEDNHEEKLDTFTKVLRGIQMNTCLDTRQIKILIELGYFEQFGSAGKLMKVYEEFFEGKNKLTKTVRSFQARLTACEHAESSFSELDLSPLQRLSSEADNIGMCLSVYPDAPANLYFAQDVDVKYGARVKLYSVQRGSSGVVRFKKNDFERQEIHPGDMIRLDAKKSPRYTFKDGVRTKVEGEYEYWANSYVLVK